MTAGLNSPKTRSELLRRLCPIGALFVSIVVVVPPLYGLARRYEFVEALQFCVFAMAVPALLVLGAPSLSSNFGHRPSGRVSHLIEKLAAGRRRHQSFARSAAFLGAFMAVVVVWRTPVAVAGLVSDQWLIVLEAASLAVVGSAFWLELVDSGRLVARARRPLRAVMAAFAMWTVWTISYLGGFSSSTWYRGFHHLAGHGFSAAADQQIATGVCWLVAALAFMPVVFWNMFAWLGSEDDLDASAYGLVRPVTSATSGPSPISS